ncbi:MAG: peptidase S10, partial [Chlamydiia bacterium]|nr:peptidase S10 [Chlamydiia bacterium]
FALGNDLPYMTFLPTYAAINWYHTGQKGTLDKVIEEANAFALGPYALALIQGNALPKEEKGKIAEKLAELTGLNRYFIEAADLRVDWLKFAKRRFDNDRKIVSRFDGRFLGYDMDPLSCNNYSDPTLDMLAPAFTSTINQYLTQVLKWEKDLEYEVLTQVGPWDYAAKATNQYLNMNKDLLELMSRDSGVKVFVANGYYDLATPFMASEYTFNHLPIAEPLRKNITFANYAAGHMMYINQKELVRLSTDLRKFITGAAAARSAHPGQVSNGKD